MGTTKAKSVPEFPDTRPHATSRISFFYTLPKQSVLYNPIFSKSSNRPNPLFFFGPEVPSRFSGQKGPKWGFFPLNAHDTFKVKVSPWGQHFNTNVTSAPCQRNNRSYLEISGRSWSIYPWVASKNRVVRGCYLATLPMIWSFAGPILLKITHPGTVTIISKWDAKRAVRKSIYIWISPVGRNDRIMEEALEVEWSDTFLSFRTWCGIPPRFLCQWTPVRPSIPCLLEAFRQALRVTHRNAGLSVYN